MEVVRRVSSPPTVPRAATQPLTQFVENIIAEIADCKTRTLNSSSEFMRYVRVSAALEDAQRALVHAKAADACLTYAAIHLQRADMIIKGNNE